MTGHPLSAKRGRLCSRDHADRVAERMFDERQRPIAIVRTGTTLQPFLVKTQVDSDDEVLMEIRT